MIHHGTDLVVKLKLGTPGAKAGLDAAPGKEAVKSYRPVKVRRLRRCSPKCSATPLTFHLL